MRKFFSNSLMLLSFLTTLSCFTGCSDENGFADVDGQAPTISLTTEHIRSEIGRKFTISGLVEDNDGLKSIRLVSPELYLDKTIDLVNLYDEIVHSYNLDYSFTTPRTQEGDTFTIGVTVTDLGNRSVEKELLLTMDGDFNAPVFTTGPSGTMAVILKENIVFDLRFSVTDDRALNRVEISIPEMELNETLPATGTSFAYSQMLSLPSEAGEYNLTLVAYDEFELSTKRTCVITVTEMPDFPKMYLADVATAEELNSDLFGIPMLIERTEAYTYKARYYAAEANTEVRFVPQKSDFAPICFGINRDNQDEFTFEPENALPLVLPQRGYYEITFNVITGVYDVQKYEPTDKPLPFGEMVDLNAGDPEHQIYFEMGLAGAGLPNTPNWSTSEPLKLTQDPSNPYLIYADMDLDAGASIEFTITRTHWWSWWPEPYYRFETGANDSGENEFNTLNGGNNMTPVTVLRGGKYRFVLDTHLLRSKFYPIN